MERGILMKGDRTLKRWVLAEGPPLSIHDEWGGVGGGAAPVCSQGERDTMPEAVIVSALRSPIGRAVKGSLKDVRADDLAALVVRAAVERSGVDPALIEDVII